MAHRGALTWLHLSDLHVQSESWQQDYVLGALVKDMPALLEERELRPDLLFVTGDVAASGQRAEYDGAVCALADLAKTLGLDRGQHVFVVPGNHDVDRGKIGRMVERDRASLLELEGQELGDATGELLGDAKAFRLYGQRLEQWCAFTEKLMGPARSVTSERPWRSDVIDLRGLPVGVLSLCTAWASGPEDRKGSIILGERQIHDMVAEACDGGARVVIALMHHPLHWLHGGEQSAIRDRLQRDTDVVLHGHVHHAHPALHLGARSAHVEIGAGAAYSGLGEDPHHGFSVGRLDLDEGRLDVHGFTWSAGSGRWHPASEVPGVGDHGRASFALPLAAIAPPTAKRGGHEVLATRLRRAATTVYATVDLAGLGRAGWPPGHVPVELRTKQADERQATTRMEDATSRGIIPSEELLHTLLGEHCHYVLLGAPGSGKSTLCRYVALQAARDEGGLAPLLLKVRDCITEGKREDLLELAVRQAGFHSIRTNVEALERLCDAGKMLLVVDGMDEVADDEARRHLRDRLQAFVGRFPQVPALVTSRIAGYHDVPLDRGFQELRIEPFDDDTLEAFVRSWYESVEADPTARVRKRAAFMHALEVEPHVKELARNPLVATLIGMVHFSHAQLPGDRARLYGLIVELLLITWPAERQRELPELHGSVQQPMLEALALRLQEQRAASERRPTATTEVLIDMETLERMLGEQLVERFPERSAPALRQLARKWGTWLVDGSGLLQVKEPGRVGFLHFSLMEHMAGRALLRRTQASGNEAVAALVHQCHADEAWKETLLLMLGSENEQRELGRAVIERLLRDESEEHAWSASVLALGLLREEVDMGRLREQVLARARDVALGESQWSWEAAHRILADVVRFGRTHGGATSEWLREQATSATGERLQGVMAVAPKRAYEQELTDWLSARSDRAEAVLALLDFGPEHWAGRWARRHATRSEWLTWARVTPIEGIIGWSFEGLVESHPAEWIPALLSRTDWLGRTSSVAAKRLELHGSTEGRRGLPRSVAWWSRDELHRVVRLVPSMSASASSHEDDVSPCFARGFARGFARDALWRFSSRLMREFEQDLERHAGLDYGLDVMRYFEMYLGIDFERDFPLDTARDIARFLTEESTPGNTDFIIAMMAEAHAAFIIARTIEQRELLSALMNARIHDRWLNMFFTPLAESATRDRPLADHPDLHALLLTYGLVQYQTTWAWPDCPHWRSWLSSPPPEHWLPAHVFHLVRSIQDPTDPTHRDLAGAALDRNDWPALAQALRCTTLVPTPPEILALFDGDVDAAPPS